MVASCRVGAGNQKLWIIFKINKLSKNQAICPAGRGTVIGVYCIRKTSIFKLKKSIEIKKKGLKAHALKAKKCSS